MDNKKHQQTGAAEIKGQGAVGIPPPPSDFAGIQNRTEVETDNITVAMNELLCLKNAGA